MPAFFVQSLRSAWQAKSEIGCLAVAVLRDTGNAFWTRTVWENEDAMRSFMLSGAQRGMHRLREWCDDRRPSDGCEPRSGRPRAQGLPPLLDVGPYTPNIPVHTFRHRIPGEEFHASCRCHCGERSIGRCSDRMFLTIFPLQMTILMKLES